MGEKLQTSCLVFFSLTVLIEFIQFFQSIFGSAFHLGGTRSSDIDDVIINTIGAIAGVCCFFLWTKIEKVFVQKGKERITA